MIYEENHPQFFTATIYEWNPLLKDDNVKDIIIISLRFLVRANRISLYGFVIMSNHLHLIPPPLLVFLTNKQPYRDEAVAKRYNFKQ